MKRTVRVFWLAAAVACAAAAEDAAGELRLIAGRGTLLELPFDAGRISISSPEVVDAVAISTRELLLNAKAPGASTVMVWSKSGRRAGWSVVVELNLEPARQLLRETFPDEDIRVQAARDSVSLTGSVSCQSVADRAAALVAPLGKAVVNNLQVGSGGPEKQILLRVRFAELDRNLSTAFGVNLISTGVANTPGGTSTGQFSAARPAELKGVIGAPIQGTTSEFTVSDMLNVFAFRPDLNLSAFVKALQSKGVLQILAEPNLVTTNGKEATFLVGGEFPFPVIQGGANAGAITIMFKEFGIRLTFTPLLTSHSTIRMHVRPEVSTIDVANQVTLSGFTIPALATRRMETNIELGLGQSFVIAGLIDDRVTENMSKIPGLSHIPILGVLFKSRQTSKTKTELVVMVTPEVTTPLAADARPALPYPTLPPEMLGPGEADRQPENRKPAK